jgi:hypothetical protein
VLDSVKFALIEVILEELFVPFEHILESRESSHK